MSLVGNFFVRIMLALAVIAVLGFDGVECVVAHIGAQGDANNAAFQAAQAWNNSHTIAAVTSAAESQLHGDEHLVGCAATAPAGLTWHCTVTRTARTVLFGHIGFLASLTSARETGSGSYQP